MSSFKYKSVSLATKLFRLALSIKEILAGRMARHFYSGSRIMAENEGGKLKIAVISPFSSLFSIRPLSLILIQSLFNLKAGVGRNDFHSAAQTNPMRKTKTTR